MKPTIILLAPSPLGAAWRDALVTGDRPLLAPEEVFLCDRAADASIAIDGPGDGQLLVVLLGAYVPESFAQVREVRPRLTLAVAENARPPESLRWPWPEPLDGVAHFRITENLAERPGRTFYAAVRTFLEGLAWA